MSKQEHIPVAKPVAQKTDYAPLVDDFDMRTAEYGDSQYLAQAEKSIRMGFVRKVYGIVVAMFAVLSATSALFVLQKDVNNFVVGNTGVLWSAYGVFILTLLVLICCDKVRRQHPHGLIGLCIFTLASSYFVGAICAMYSVAIGPYTVLQAFIATILMVCALTAFAFQTKYDFTKVNGFFVIIFMMFFLFLMFQFAIVLPEMHGWRTVYSVVGAGFMCFFIVYDTQLMLGGKHKYAISVDEHIFAALNLYLDIINLLLYLLALLSGGKR
jgi:FtsH-binding integral membrane protein|eukprot:Stramenopile-MAST_4_protein_5342